MTWTDAQWARVKKWVMGCEVQATMVNAAVTVCIIGNVCVLSTYYIPCGHSNQKSLARETSICPLIDEVTEELMAASMDFLKVEKV